MAVILDYINLIVPIEKIEEHYPGGFSQYKIDMKDSIGREIWYDDYLVRDGAKSEYDIDLLIPEWELCGLEGTVKVNGEDHWEDFCVVRQFEGATLPCDWLKTEGDTASHIKDNSKIVIYRNNKMKQFKTSSKNHLDAHIYEQYYKISDREFIETEKGQGRIISVKKDLFLVEVVVDGSFGLLEIPFTKTYMKDPYSETDKDLFFRTSALFDKSYPASTLQTMPPIKVMSIEKWTEAVNNSPKSIIGSIRISKAMEAYSQPDESF